MEQVTITLRTEDAEPVLRLQAEKAARYGAYSDYITRKCYRMPSYSGHGPFVHATLFCVPHKRPMPSWRGSVHEEACRQAADRVVRRWKAAHAMQRAA
jgi:hypothetical protein